MSQVLFHRTLGLLHPGENREHLFQLNPGQALYPLRHEPFDLNEHPQIPPKIFHHGDVAQFSYTVALTFTGWDIRDGVTTCNWHVTTSPASRDVADALDVQINGRSVTDDLKRIASMMGKALPLIYGSCAYVRVAHCGLQPAIIDAHLEFLHGINIVRRNYLLSTNSWWRWTYNLFPRGPLSTVPDLWQGVQNRQMIENVLLTAGMEIIRRVEKIPGIANAMRHHKIDRAQESGHTILIGGRERAMKRRAEQDGWTRCSDDGDPEGLDLVAKMLEQHNPQSVPRPIGLGKASDHVAPPPPPKNFGAFVTPASRPLSDSAHQRHRIPSPPSPGERIGTSGQASVYLEPEEDEN